MFRLLVLAAVIAGSLVGGGGSTASADYQICAKVWTHGTVIGSHNVGDCTPYSGPVLCSARDAGLDPSAHVYYLVCIPD
jgi:hypothetical protein